jgi:hypothetical protein
MHWEEEAYTRKDKDGNPISLVSLDIVDKEPELTASKIEYEKIALEKKLGKWHIMSRGDATLFAITG